MTDWLAKKSFLLAKFNPSHDELGRFSSASNSSVAPAGGTGGGRGGGANSTLAFTEGGDLNPPKITVGEHQIYLERWGSVYDSSLPPTDDNWVESFQAIYEGPATEEWTRDSLSNAQWFDHEQEHAEGLLIEWLQKVSAGAKQI